MLEVQYFLLLLPDLKYSDDVGVEAVQTRALTFRESFAVLSAAVVPSTL